MDTLDPRDVNSPKQGGIFVAERVVERRLAASLAVEVVGYARLMEADAGGTLPRLNSGNRM